MLPVCLPRSSASLESCHVAVRPVHASPRQRLAPSRRGHCGRPAAARRCRAERGGPHRARVVRPTERSCCGRAAGRHRAHVQCARATAGAERRRRLRRWASHLCGRGARRRRTARRRHLHGGTGGRRLDREVARPRERLAPPDRRGARSCGGRGGAREFGCWCGSGHGRRAIQRGSDRPRDSAAGPGDRHTPGCSRSGR